MESDFSSGAAETEAQPDVQEGTEITEEPGDSDVEITEEPETEEPKDAESSEVSSAESSSSEPSMTSSS